MTGVPMTVEQRRRRNAGPLMTGWEVARAVARTLQLRLSPWLDEAARQQGLETAVPRPQAIVLRSGVVAYADDAFPAIVVTYRATAMRSRSDGELEGEFQIRVLTVLDDPSPETALRTAAIYEVAIQACLVTTLGEYDDGLVRVIAPTQSAVDAREPSGVVSDVLFTVTAGPVLSKSGYLAPPDEASPDDQGDQGSITDVELVVEPIPAGGSDDDAA